MSEEQLENKPCIYQIKVQGRLNEYWSTWFDGLDITLEGEQVQPLTTLTGPVADQAALRGILNKMWDLNLSLVSVTRLDAPPGESEGPPAPVST